MSSIETGFLSNLNFNRLTSTTCIRRQFCQPRAFYQLLGEKYRKKTENVVDSLHTIRQPVSLVVVVSD